MKTLKKIAIVIPIHLYPFDVQGNLELNEKIEMYNISLKYMRNLYPNCTIILCGHGEKKIETFNQYVDLILWSDEYILPDKYGLFKNNPAQYKIVSMGCKKALNLKCTHIIKTRGDGIIYNSKQVLEDIKNNPEKLWITQQTSFSCPMMGDCFMYGPASLIEGIWSMDRNPTSKDGLINTAMAFMDYIGMSVDSYNKAIFKYCEYRDIPELEIYDLRWNFKKFSHEFLKGTFVNKSRFYWGGVNRWIIYKKDKIHRFDRNIFYTKNLFYSKFVRFIENRSDIKIKFLFYPIYKIINYYF